MFVNNNDIKIKRDRNGKINLYSSFIKQFDLYIKNIIALFEV